MKNLQKVGSKWRYRKMINGKVYSKYYDHKPKESDIIIDIKNYEEKTKEKKKLLIDALWDYLNVNDQTLSPSTYFGYLRNINSLEKNYKDFLSLNIFDIDKFAFQTFINDYSSTHKPKTVKNTYSQIKVAIQLYREDFNIKIVLPKNIKEEPYIPTDNDIKLLLNYAKDTDYYIPIRLGLMGMRLSEVYALTLDDIGDGEIKICKAKVRGYSGYELKSTKTQASVRTIKVEKELTDLIKENKVIIKGHPSNISRFMKVFTTVHHIPSFSFHKLRHYYCSMMISEGVPFQYVQKLGGWSSDAVMKKVYTHSLKDRDYSDVGINYIKKIQNQ